MKKLILCICFLFCLGNLQAQRTQFGFFIHPHSNFQTIDATNIEGSTNIGFSYGVVFDYALTDQFILHTGLAHTLLSSNLIYSLPNSDERETQDYSLQYVEIPFSIKVKTNELGHFKYFGLFGLSPGFPVRARKDFGSLAFSEENVRAGKDLVKLNFPLIFGAGIEYALAERTALFGQLQFNNGLTNVYDDNDKNKISWKQLGIKAGIFF